MIVESTLLVTLFSREAVTLLRETTKNGLSIGRVFLAINPGTGVVDYQTAASEMIAKVKLNLGCRVRMDVLVQRASWRCAAGYP